MTDFNPVRWIWGLVPVLFVALLAVLGELPKIERDLTVRAKESLEQAGYSWAVVRFQGRNAILTGQAVSSEERSAALDLLSRLRGVSAVKDQAELLPVVRPYTWTANRKGDSARIKGHVPSDALRQTILGIAKATMPDMAIDDRMVLAAGTPPREQWLGAVSFALNQLAQLTKGSVRLSDLQFVIVGEAKSLGAYEAVEAAIAAPLPAGMALGRGEVQPPAVQPYVWSATLRDGVVTVAGHVPSPPIRKQLLDHVSGTLTGMLVVDRMTLASGAPGNWSLVAMIAASALSKLEEGEATTRDKEFTIVGVAPNETVATEVSAMIRKRLPKNFKLADSIRVREGARQPQRPKAESGRRTDRILAQPPAGHRSELRYIRTFKTRQDSVVVVGADNGA